MTLIIFTALFLIAACFSWLTWQRLSWAIYTLALIFLVSVGSGLAPAWLLADLQSPYRVNDFNHWGKRNVIVLLGYGTEKTLTHQIEPGTFAYGRILKTLSLYRACKKVSRHCKIIVSGGDARHHGVSEASTYGAYLLTVGVKKDDLLLETRSMNTWQNAQFTSTLLNTLLKRQNGGSSADRVLLVSSAMHMRRSLLYFSHFGLQPTAVYADYLSAVPSFLPTAYNFAVTDLALHEYSGVLRYHVYNSLGWNVKAIRPGAL